MLICETLRSRRMLTETSFSAVLNHILPQCISFCLIILPWCTTYIRGSSRYGEKLSIITDKFIHRFVSCLLSHPSSFGSFSRRIYFLRKQHYMHPFNKLPILLCLNRLWRWTTSSVRFMEWWAFSFLNGSLLSSNKLITRNRLWNTGAVTQESLQNSSLGKISVSFRVKEQ